MRVLFFFTLQNSTPVAWPQIERSPACLVPTRLLPAYVYEGLIETSLRQTLGVVVQDVVRVNYVPVSIRTKRVTCSCSF